METVSPLEWGLFAGVVLVLLAVDLFSHRGARAESRGWALAWSIIWIAAGLLFAIYVWLRLGAVAAQEYVAAYFIEKSLSLDNLFVFLIIFRALSIPKKNQRTALTWGVFGAIVFRGIFIFIGVALARRLDWIDYVFGGILALAAYHALREDPTEERRSTLVDWLSRHLRVTPDNRQREFLVRHDGKWMVTPLFVAVLALEVSDIMFAIDSVPAAFSVTRVPFLIYSSNVFAILGLRSLYLVLAHALSGLRYIHYGLAAILAFAAFKLIADKWLHVPPLISVGIIAACITASTLASLWWAPERDGHKEPADETHEETEGSSNSAPDEH